ncbi:3-oxoadipate enol-lactonase [Sphingobium yanoikuyae]|uniref:3-oxoadipate enol-lactonase n=1 Tax=Sphingobium yanoikuyae TaxID=13690 RepID=UPI0022DCF080|nr:3-oxoadipate enol-lactonase [Sphingobium yanoikuyae]WBQ17621.1 3-oxoadipate enol-lactonase [Sphingobium yanoikuyae]
MPTTVRDGIRLHWESDGDRAGCPLLLLNSIGTDLHLWDRVMPSLAGLHVLRMDTRGHGRSDAPSGDYSLESLADDVISVLDDAGISRAAIAGVSLGGMIAMEVALAHADRVSALIPICTSATMDQGSWAARVNVVREQGTGAILDLAMGRFLSPGFRESDPDASARIAEGLRLMAPEGYAGCAAAIRDMDVYWQLESIHVPTLVVAGDLDTSTPFTGHGEHIVEAVDGAQVVHLDAAHLAPLEAPEALAHAITSFLDALSRRAAATTGTRSPRATSNTGEAS